MAEHHLERTIKGTLDDAILDALLSARCDDATVSNKRDLIFAQFDREAPTMLAAVMSAIDQVESVDGLEVLQSIPRRWCGPPRSPSGSVAPGSPSTS